MRYPNIGQRLRYVTCLMLSCLSLHADPLCIAHRGLARTHPENSLEAIVEGWAAGADIVEVDLRMTADGKVALFHDAEIHGAAIGEATLAQLQLAAGRKVATLPQALALATPTKRLLLDLKEDSAKYLRIVAEAIENSGATTNSLLLQSWSIEGLASMRYRLPGHERYVVTSLNYRGLTRDPPSAKVLHVILAQEHLTGISFKGRRFVDAEFVRQLKASGHRAFVWTINDPERIRHYATLGVDGIITDRPDLWPTATTP